MKTNIIRTYWRNNDNPFPGKLTETKIVKATKPVFSCLDREAAIESKTIREIKTAAEIAERFESLVDAAMEGGYQ